jgi:hypothetical protein
MGTNNRQRRRAKKLARQRRGHNPRPRVGPHGPGCRCDLFDGVGDDLFGLGPDDGYDETDEFDGLGGEGAELVRAAVLACAEVHRLESDEDFDLTFAGLVRMSERVGTGAVDEAVAFWAGLALDRAWTGHWQPGDIERVLGRKRGAGAVAAMAAHVVASASGRKEATSDGRWASQLAGLRADASGPPAAGGRAWEDHLLGAVKALSLLLYLPPLPDLGRPSAKPGSGPRRSRTSVLERVRALLAQAESTTFPEEAETFTAKAQELMARHSIDEAMIDAASPDGGSGATIVGWRIGVDDPYASPKSLLLHYIAKANRCHSVYSGDFGFATVFGTENDLEVVELLFTSLLVQATDAMVRAGSSVDRWGRSRTRSFRQSFLVAYSVRIGERLEAVTRQMEAEGAERYGGALLPVLASREAAVDEAVTRAFPELTHKAMSVTNPAGYRAGRAAAELASLSVGEALPGG